jgi:hypothetical protein
MGCPSALTDTQKVDGLRLMVEGMPVAHLAR